MTTEGPQFEGAGPHRSSPPSKASFSDDISLPPPKSTTSPQPPRDSISLDPDARRTPDSPHRPASSGGRKSIWAIALGLAFLAGLAWWFGAEPSERERLRERQERYAAREEQMSDDEKELLEELRAEVARRNLTFTVGYTSALARKPWQVAGFNLPDNVDIATEARRQNAVADAALDQAPSRVEPPTSPDAVSFDLRREGMVTPVRNQGICASCWAFATVGAFESNWLRNYGSAPDAVDLSEQQVLNCSDFGNCVDGGWWAFEYLRGNGVGDEKAYPYQGQDLPPNEFQPSQFQALTWGYVPADPNTGLPTVAAMKAALVEHGALAVTVRSNDLFRAYTGGVFNDDDRSRPDHAVLLIGWDDTKQAWLIKNSWGAEWGEECSYGDEYGYMWIAYGSNSIGKMAAWVEAAAP